MFVPDMFCYHFIIYYKFVEWIRLFDRRKIGIIVVVTELKHWQIAFVQTGLYGPWQCLLCIFCYWWTELSHFFLRNHIIVEPEHTKITQQYYKPTTLDSSWRLLMPSKKLMRNPQPSLGGATTYIPLSVLIKAPKEEGRLGRGVWGGGQPFADVCPC